MFPQSVPSCLRVRAEKVGRTLFRAGVLSALLGANPIQAQQVGGNKPFNETFPLVTDFDHARSEQTISLGGRAVIQDIMSRDGSAEQIAAIRAYLRAQAEAFPHRGILLPAGTSQDDLAGLAELQAGTNRATVRFAETSNGGRLIFETKEPLLWQALSVLTGHALQEQGVKTELTIGIPPETPALREQPP